MKVYTCCLRSVLLRKFQCRNCFLFFRSFLLYEFFRDDISWHLNRSIPQADCPGFRTGNSTLTKFEKKRTFESNFYRMEFLANNSIFAQKTGTDLQPTFVFFTPSPDAPKSNRGGSVV